MYSTYNEEKYVVADRFITTLKNKIYKHMRAVTKKAYFDVLDDKTYHSSIKMNPIDVKCNSYAEYNVDSDSKGAKFKISDHVRFSKYESIFVKRCASNWSKEVLIISKIKNTVPRNQIKKNLEYKN